MSKPTTNGVFACKREIKSGCLLLRAGGDCDKKRVIDQHSRWRQGGQYVSLSLRPCHVITPTRHRLCRQSSPNTYESVYIQSHLQPGANKCVVIRYEVVFVR